MESEHLRRLGPVGQGEGNNKQFTHKLSRILNSLLGPAVTLLRTKSLPNVSDLVRKVRIND
jgi:hypothetical protein